MISLRGVFYMSENEKFGMLDDNKLENVDGGKMSKEAIAGTVVGGLGAVTAIGLGTYFGVKKRKEKKEQKAMAEYKAELDAAEAQAKKDYEERSQTKEFKEAFEQFDTSNLPVIDDPVEP